MLRSFRRGPFIDRRDLSSTRLASVVGDDASAGSSSV